MLLLWDWPKPFPYLRSSNDHMLSLFAMLSSQNPFPGRVCLFQMTFSIVLPVVFFFSQWEILRHGVIHVSYPVFCPHLHTHCHFNCFFQWWLSEVFPIGHSLSSWFAVREMGEAGISSISRGSWSDSASASEILFEKRCSLLIPANTERFLDCLQWLRWPWTESTFLHLRIMLSRAALWSYS